MHAVQELETETPSCTNAAKPPSLAVSLNKLDNGPGTMFKVTTKNGRPIATKRVDDQSVFRPGSVSGRSTAAGHA